LLLAEFPQLLVCKLDFQDWLPSRFILTLFTGVVKNSANRERYILMCDKGSASENKKAQPVRAGLFDVVPAAGFDSPKKSGT